jgi:hypothetical protein
MTEDSKSLQSDITLPIEIVDSFFPEQIQDNHESHLVNISRVLKTQGVPDSQLCEALAVLIGIISSKLGDPVPMVITEDEGAGAVEFLDVCLSLVPQDSWVDIATIPTKGVALDGSISGKTIICYDGDQFKKDLMGLIKDVERGCATKKLKSLSSSENNLTNSFIALVRDLDHPVLQNRYVTRIHISADEDSKKTRMGEIAKKIDPKFSKTIEIESACVRTLFQRAKNLPVDVEFADKIMKDSAIRLQNAVPIYDLSLRLLRNIARINNVPPLRPFEHQIAFIGLDYNEIFPIESSRAANPLIATKVDYYYFLTIFGDFLSSGYDFLTPRQNKVFFAIYSYNMKGMATRRNRYPTGAEALNALHSQALSKTWITRDDLFKALRTAWGEDFSKITLHNELHELLKRQLIVRRRSKHRRYRYEYAANQVPTDNIIFNTNFDEIVDSRYKGENVQVNNIYAYGVENL